MVKAKRKGFGHGRAAMQKAYRNSRAHEIAYILLDRVDQDHIVMTGQLFPRGTLKSSKNRRLFDWVAHYPGRVFTSALRKLVIKKLLRLIGQVALNPSQTFGEFVNQQSHRLGRLVRQAKRLKDPGLDGVWIGKQNSELDFSFDMF